MISTKACWSRAGCQTSGGKIVEMNRLAVVQPYSRFSSKKTGRQIQRNWAEKRQREVNEGLAESPEVMVDGRYGGGDVDGAGYRRVRGW